MSSRLLCPPLLAAAALLLTACASDVRDTEVLTRPNATLGSPCIATLEVPFNAPMSVPPGVVGISGAPVHATSERVRRFVELQRAQLAEQVVARLRERDVRATICTPDSSGSKLTLVVAGVTADGGETGRVRLDIAATLGFIEQSWNRQLTPTWRGTLTSASTAVDPGTDEAALRKTVDALLAELTSVGWLPPARR